ncbi:MAG: hypothetical protein RL885_27480 [Planctomycetota bacterium]
MKRLASLLALLLTLAATVHASPELITGLTVLNDTHLARSREVVSYGIPFAEGKLFDADLDRLVVLDATGQLVPSQTRVLARWTPFPAIKWVLVTFPASVAAFSEARYRIFLDDNPHSYSGRNIENDLALLRHLFATRSVQGIVTDHFGNRFIPTEPKLTVEEAGPLKNLIRVDAYHRNPSFPRDFLWSTAYITLYHDGVEPKPHYKIEWYLKNSYTLRPLGHVKFKNFYVQLRHHSQSPNAIFGDPAWSTSNVPASKGYYGELDQPILWGRGGDANSSSALTISRAWETYPKAIEVDSQWTRAWVLPDGDYVIGDGQHIGVKLGAALDLPAIDTPNWALAFDMPLLYRIDQPYLQATNAWGDFGVVADVQPGQRVPSLEYKLKRYGWNEYGEYHHSTHAAGSPRNHYSYLLPYMQTGHREHWQWVEDQLLISMNQRPYHWTTLEKEFDRDDFQDDRLWDGYWEWRRPGAGYQARQNLPPELAPWRADSGNAWNGWDFEHMTVDDLRDYYLVTGHPKALESLEEVAQGFRSYEMTWDRDQHVHSGRVLGWCLRALVDAYYLTGDEDYWNAATHMVDTALLRDGWRYKIENGWPNGWEPFFYDTKIQSGQSNYDHFKPWMSAIGGVGLIRYLDASYRRHRAGLSVPIPIKRVFRFVVDTADLIVNYGFIPNQGFIYEMSIYDDNRDGYSGGTSGTPEWNVEFLMLVAYLTGKASYFGPAKWILDYQRGKRDLRSNPWYQVSLRVAGY